MAFMRKHWGSIVAVLSPAIVSLINFLTPSLTAYVKAHPHALWAIVISSFLVLYNSRAPKDKAQTGAKQ